jgi:hypothetical protein
MQKWEYIFLHVSKGLLDASIYVFSTKNERKKIRATNPIESQIVQILNDYGGLGWEVTGVHSLGEFGKYETTWTLKRPAPNSGDNKI